MKRKFMMVVLAGLFLVGTWQTALAKKWQPYQFKGNERFEYEVISWEDEEEKEALYILDIKELEEDTFEVTYITKGTLKKEELGMETAYGLWGFYGVSLNALILNPFYCIYFQEMDLEVGEKMSFWGAGLIKVIEKEEIAGREGFVCQFFQTIDDEEELVAEWTIDPELALPLRSKVFSEEKVESQIELIKYTEY